MYVLLGRILFWLSWPALYLYLRGTTRSRVIVEVEGEILLVKGWHDGAKWSLPGGGVHKGEDPSVSALREVKEETGIVLTDATLVDLGADTYSHRGFQYDLVRFGCRLQAKPEVKRQKREIVAVGWFTVAEITPQLVEDNVLRQLAAWQQIRYTS